VARRLGTMTEHGVGKQRGLVRSALAGDTRLRAEFNALRDRVNSKGSSAQSVGGEDEELTTEAQPGLGSTLEY